VSVRSTTLRAWAGIVTPEGRRLPDRLRATGYITGLVPWHVGETLAGGRKATYAADFGRLGG